MKYIENLKLISLFLTISTIIVLISGAIGSNYLFKFLDENLITILIALLAINTTTGSVVMTKLKEITDKNKIDFSPTTKELKKSVTEQVISILLATALLIVKDSNSILASYQNSELILNILVVSVFASSIYNLYDTANSIFIILEFENNDEQ